MASSSTAPPTQNDASTQQTSEKLYRFFQAEVAGKLFHTPLSSPPPTTTTPSSFGLGLRRKTGKSPTTANGPTSEQSSRRRRAHRRHRALRGGHHAAVERSQRCVRMDTGARSEDVFGGSFRSRRHSPGTTLLAVNSFRLTIVYGARNLVHQKPPSPTPRHP